MTAQRCLRCQMPLEPDATDYHASCARELFGASEPPELDDFQKPLEQFALQLIQSQSTITGAQPKLSLQLSRPSHNARGRLTVVGLWGDFILKPQTPKHPELPEVEALTMLLASIAGIETAACGLIGIGGDSRRAYITRRMDRVKGGKLAMEDFCQLTEKLTEHKYRGSYEQVARAILRHSSVPGLDVLNFCEVVLFSFLTGNADMHLKNFSLIEKPGLGMGLAPAYDLVNTELVNPADNEEMALSLNGRRNKIRRTDFEAAFETAGLTTAQQRNLFRKMADAVPRWQSAIATSFLSPESRGKYWAIVEERTKRLGLV